MARSRHSKKEVEAILQYAESLGWRVVQNKRGHAWGKLMCPLESRDGCRENVYSTPQNVQNHAAHLLRKIQSCKCFDADVD